VLYFITQKVSRDRYEAWLARKILFILNWCNMSLTSYRARHLVRDRISWYPQRRLSQKSLLSLTSILSLITHLSKSVNHCALRTISFLPSFWSISHWSFNHIHTSQDHKSKNAPSPHNDFERCDARYKIDQDSVFHLWFSWFLFALSHIRYYSFLFSL